MVGETQRFIVLLLSVVACTVSSAASADLSQVRSFAYVIAPGPEGNLPSVLSAVSKSPFDMVILGNYPKGTVISRTPNDPINAKLIIGYIDVGESTDVVTKGYLGGVLQTWFGTAVPGFSNLYSVQFWNPQWKAIIHAQIDDQIAAGYDGIFLDVLDGFNSWIPGNSRGNAPYQMRPARWRSCSPTFVPM